MIVYVQIKGCDADVTNLAREIYYTSMRHTDVAEELDVEIDVTVIDGCSLWIVPFKEWMKEHE